MEDVSKEWLELQKSQLKASSIAKYSNILNSYIVPYFGSKDIITISRNDVTAFSRELLESGGAKAKGLSPKTVNGILSVMKNVFEFATHEKELQTVNISNISVKQSQKPMRILSRQEQN